MAVQALRNSADQAIARKLIQRAAEASRIYEGDYRAAWLLSPSIFSDVWSLARPGGETRVVGGQVKDDIKFDWRLRITDGTLLTDVCNANLLRSLQKIGFVARAIGGGPDTAYTHLAFLYQLCNFARWLIAHGRGLDIRLNAFSRVTREDFCDYVQSLAAGGLAFALGSVERLLTTIYPLALGRDPSQEELASPMTLDASDCQKVRDWFVSQGHFKKEFRSGHGRLRIKMSAVADLISTEPQTLATNSKFRAFLSQFDVGPLEAQQGAVRGIGDTQREYPSHRSKTARQASGEAASEGTTKTAVDGLRMLVALHRHLPDICPDPAEFRPKELMTIGERYTRAKGATPWIPLKTALAYTTESLRWVHVYGAALVDVFLESYALLHKEGLLRPPPQGTDAEQTESFTAAAKARQALIATVEIPEVLKPLNINGWRSYMCMKGQLGFAKLRSEPSMRDAIMVLIGAIAIIIATMKPMRDSELRRLKRQCIYFKKGDGYWLVAGQKKRSVAGVDPKLARPVPAIVATAVQLLRRLTDGLKAIIGVTDEWLLDCLFAMPLFARYEAKISGAIAPIQLSTLLDTFCDYVAMPPDSLGRRWYVRVHELRKSFLITFFWTYKYANLEAAAWMAGHVEVEDVYAYIRAIIPGQELPEIEAEYASRVLRSQPEDPLASELEEVDQLHEAVCLHFQVSDVSWIDSKALQHWLEMRFASGEFSIEPYSVPLPRGGSETHIAFRIRTVQ